MGGSETEFFALQEQVGFTQSFLAGLRLSTQQKSSTRVENISVNVGRTGH